MLRDATFCTDESLEVFASFDWPCHDDDTLSNGMESFPQVENAEDLPNCTKNREDSILVTLDENVVYRCSA